MLVGSRYAIGADEVGGGMVVIHRLVQVLY